MTSANRMRRRLTRTFLTALAVMLVAGTALAGTFVSFNGKFHFDFPSTWEQIDYRTADYYLNKDRSADEALNYEAVFADGTVKKVFAGQYLILTVDTVGQLNSDEIDSVLDVMSDEFHRSVVRTSADSFLVNWDEESIYYDSARQAVGVVSQLTDEQGGPRYSLMGMKFYKHGIANFFFYSPEGDFESGLPVYKEMIFSLSTENLQAALPAETAKVAQLNSGHTLKYVALIAGLLVIVIVVFLAFRRKAGNPPDEDKAEG